MAAKAAPEVTVVSVVTAARPMHFSGLLVAPAVTADQLLVELGAREELLFRLLIVVLLTEVTAVTAVLQALEVMAVMP
jgi:hypothetical protein